jgi:hypothetical protein
MPVFNPAPASIGPSELSCEACEIADAVLIPLFDSIGVATTYDEAAISVNHAVSSLLFQANGLQEPEFDEALIGTNTAEYQPIFDALYDELLDCFATGRIPKLDASVMDMEQEWIERIEVGLFLNAQVELVRLFSLQLSYWTNRNGGSND